MEQEYQYPVYGTQGGGLARWTGHKWIFVTKPSDGTGLDVGDEVPEMWDLQPANDLARRETDLVRD